MTKTENIIITHAINSMIPERMIKRREHHPVKFPFFIGRGIAFFIYDPHKRRITSIEYTKKGKTKNIELNYENTTSGS